MGTGDGAVYMCDDGACPHVSPIQYVTARCVLGDASFENSMVCCQTLELISNLLSLHSRVAAGGAGG